MLDLYYENPDNVQVGLDEAGRGSLVGPVVCAGVIWPHKFDHPLLREIRDSKKVSPKKRKLLRDFIVENSIYDVQFIDESRIDNVNILNATMEGFHKVLNELSYDFVLVDGNSFTPHVKKNGEFSQFVCIPEGDAKYLSIASASILAKVFRDEFMESLCNMDNDLDVYDIRKNYGYGTKSHMNAIHLYGPSKYHRKSFAPVKNM